MRPEAEIVNEFEIKQVSYSQKRYLVSAKNRDEARKLHEEGKSKFDSKGGCSDGEIVNIEINEVG